MTLEVRLLLGEIKKGGEEFFSKKIRGAKTFFQLKKGGRRLFFRRNKGGEDFFSTKKRGVKTFFQANFPKTRPRYPVNFDRSLRQRGCFQSLFQPLIPNQSLESSLENSILSLQISAFLLLRDNDGPMVVSI